MTIWEQYAQDESIVTVDHAAREDYRLSCDCGWRARARGETLANELSMHHILVHDIAYEEARESS